MPRRPTRPPTARRPVSHRHLSRQDRQLYAAWSAADAPDAWEIERDRRIAELQGRGNRFVEDYGRP